MDMVAEGCDHCPCGVHRIVSVSLEFFLGSPRAVFVLRAQEVLDGFAVGGGLGALKSF